MVKCTLGTLDLPRQSFTRILALINKSRLVLPNIDVVINDKGIKLEYPPTHVHVSMSQYLNQIRFPR